MRLSRSFFEWTVAASLLAFGCTPSIGDSCKLHTDCSATGNRLCEPNLPGGYCTIFNCEPDTCPSEAACVAFGVAPSTDPECAVTQQQRLERTFCMARCSSDSSCRSGYACVDLQPMQPGASDNVWGAAVLDKDRGTKVCTVKASSAAAAATKSLLAGASAEVCSPPLDASFQPAPPPPDSGFTADAMATDAMTTDAIAPLDAAPARDAARVAPDAQSGP